MNVFKLLALAVIFTVAVLVLRTYRPELAVVLGIAGGAVVLISVLDSFTGVRSAVDMIVQRYGLSGEHIKVVFKVIGIAYVAQFAAQTCRDAGESAMGAKVELMGRVLIITAALPVIVSVLDILGGLLQSA